MTKEPPKTVIFRFSGFLVNAKNPIILPLTSPSEAGLLEESIQSQN